MWQIRISIAMEIAVNLILKVDKCIYVLALLFILLTTSDDNIDSIWVWTSKE